MAGFRKAKPQQAALKMGIYGPPGSGKTFSGLLFAEGLARISKKRIAFVDTERGTDFYAQDVAERACHPAAFDFDAIYTRSLMEISDAVRAIKPTEYSVVVIDSISHVWEAAKSAYSGKETRINTIPFHAWPKIKKPYRDLLSFLMSSPLHVFVLGRQGNEFEEDEESGEMKKVGVKMKAEAETAYEPHILLRMETPRDKDGSSIPTAYAEKDRTGILAGKVLQWPKYDNVIKPLIHLLGESQAEIESEDAVSRRDAEAIEAADTQRERASAETLRKFTARIALTETKESLAAIGKEITPDVKAGMTNSDLVILRECYGAREKVVK